MEQQQSMDIGCRFYTPVQISAEIANHAGKKDLVVDLFSGIGNLYRAFLKRGFTEKAIAFDINPSAFDNNNCDKKVINKIVDCLNPAAIEEELNGHRNSVTAFLLNPPFKRIPKVQELLYWEKFDGFKPKLCTQRIECVAIAAALKAAPLNCSLYIIIPEIVLDSKQTLEFFDILKTKYSMTVVKKYKRAKFSSAEVDVAIIMLQKQSNNCVTEFFTHETCQNDHTKNDYKVKDSNCNFHLFRGKVHKEKDRKNQISAKDLKKGGVNIIGIEKEQKLKKSKESNYSQNNDILIARVGQRMIGRVGMLRENCALTNESIFSLRIPSKQLRIFVYDKLTSAEFLKWCDSTARGTANYFLTAKDLKYYLINLIEENNG